MCPGADERNDGCRFRVCGGLSDSMGGGQRFVAKRAATDAHVSTCESAPGTVHMDRGTWNGWSSGPAGSDGPHTVGREA